MQRTFNIREFFADSSIETRMVVKILASLVFLAALATVLSSGVFLQPANLLNITLQNAILILVTVGQMLVIITTGGVDLSIGGILALSSVLIVLFQDYGLAGSLAVALGASLVFGLINGALVTFVRLPSFVVTLATFQIISSIAMVISGGGAVYTGLQGAQLASSLQMMYKTSLLGIPVPIVMFTLAMLVIALYLRTSVGHASFAIGGNERAAFLSGIPVWVTKMAAYAFVGLLAGVGGAMFVGRVGMGDPQTGKWLALDSIAAVSIGGGSLSGGIGTVPGTLIGVFIISVIDNIMNLLNVPPTFQPAVQGIVILLAVYLNSTKKQS